jgi:hypothetical protein
MKTKLLLLPVLFLFISKLSAQPGLIACYPLDNNADDFSGYNNNGTAHNLTATTDRFGSPNNAYHFSGANSYIDIPDSSFLLNEYTYSLWCRPADTPSFNNGYGVISIGGDIADQAIQVVNGSVQGPAFGGGGYDINFQTHGCSAYSSPLSINQWYHVVLTRNDSVINFYIDGLLICSSNYSASAAGYMDMSGTVTANIGKRAGSVPQYFIGDIDEVKIFNRVLSLSEIQSMESKCSLSGIGDLLPNNTALNIFPNPATGTINITTVGNLNNIDVKIFNLIGENIYSGVMNGYSTQIYLDTPAGIYFVKLSDGKRSCCKKLVVDQK